MSNYQLPEGYKQTEIGVIPEDWEVGFLGNILKLDNGFAFKSEYFSDIGLIVLTPGNFRLEGGLYFNDRNIKRYSGDFPESTVFQKGDLLVVMTDLTPDCNLLGKPAFVELEEPILHNQRIGKIGLLSSNVDKKFLYFLLLSNSYLRRIKEQATGSTVRHTSNKSIYSISLPIPKRIEEQRSLAQALSDVDALISALDKLIAKKRDLKTATMQQLLTGKKRLPGFSGARELISMSKNASLKARIGWQALTTEEYLDSGSFFLVTGTDFIGGRVNWDTCHFVDEWRYSQDKNIQLKNGDVLLTKDGTIGKVGYVESLFKPATLNSGVFVIRPLSESFEPLFLYYILSSRIFDDFLAKIFAGSTISHLYQKDFVTFEFLAPEIEEQRAIATVLSDMDNAISALESRQAKTKAIKQGMMQELLTGRIRLKIEK